MGLVGEVIGIDANAVATDQAGLEVEKFHLVAAAFNTSAVSMSRSEE